jgi:phospholipid/cholesterol/gamma-HCH transport system substrate-binding protein
MPQSSTRNILVGLFVLVGLASLGWLSINLGGVSVTPAETSTIYAHFDDVGGLSARAKVTISGVKVGQVAEITLDEDYRARVAFELRADLELPYDTSASILTSGVLGDQYVSLLPGAEEEYLAPGETIEFTESALSLERLIGKLIHQTSLGDDE